MKIPILGFAGEPDQNYTVVPQQQLEQMISNLYKLEGGIQTTYDPTKSWYCDTYYTALPIETHFKVVLEWWRAVLSHVAYTPETFDCDDFASLLSSLMAACGYNCCGKVIGELYYQDQFLGYHEWNLFLFINNQGIFKVMEFEPQTCDILINHQSPDGFKYVGRWVFW